MLRLVARRFIAMFASLVLSAAILSAQASIFAAETSDCCANGMCPMRHLTVHAANCDMDMSRPQSQLQPCPTPNLHYVAALIFVRVAPPTLLANERSGEKPTLVTSVAAPVTDLDVAAPPPRTTFA